MASNTAKWIIAMALGAALSLSAHAQALWRLSRDTKTIHIIGAVHVGKPESHSLSPAVRDALSRADVVAFETSADSFSQLTAPPLRGEGFENNESGIKVLKDCMREQGMSAQTQTTRMWMVFVGCAIFREREAGYASEFGLESRVKEFLSSQPNKPTVGLEGSSELVVALSSISDATILEAAALDETLASTEIAGMHVAGNINALYSGSDDDIDRLIRQDFYGDSTPKEFRRHILVDRNSRFVQRLEALSEQHSHIAFVVGLYHTLGPDGVIRQLVRAGFSSSRQ